MSSKNSSQPAIKVESVSKLFRKQNQRTFKELLPALFGGKKISESFWALKDINLTINKGETIGIIGANGSGKSTLLKLIAGVSQPTKGKIKVNGKIAPLIELGAGFHPELTGRENVHLNGIILGMKKTEVENKFAEIVAFAELENFIDEPVKHYSSGMYLRLAFAVAVHTDPDILLVDEILAVGDSKFQAKCLAKISEMVKNGKTLVIVSHDLAMIEKYCEKAFVLVRGENTFVGKSSDAVAAFNETTFGKITNSKTEIANLNSWGDKQAEITSVKIESDDKENSFFYTEQSLSIVVNYRNPHNLPLNCSIGIYKDDDTYIAGFNSSFDQIASREKSEGAFILHLPKLLIKTGEYYLRICLFSDSESSPHHFLHKAKKLIVRERKINSRGIVDIPRNWKD